MAHNTSYLRMCMPHFSIRRVGLEEDTCMDAELSVEGGHAS